MAAYARRPPTRSPLVVAACLLAAVTGAAAGDRPAPYDVAVEVRWGAPAGPESFRGEAALRLVRELEAEGCFASVRSQAPGTWLPDVDLVLVFALDDFEERLDYEQSIAARTSPNRVPHEEDRQVVADLEVGVRAWMQLPGTDGATVRSGRFHEQEAYRPRFREDPRVEVESLVLDGVVRHARKFACAKPGRLEDDLARARSASD